MTDRPVTFITGASRGIGKYLAETYLARGHVVAGCSRTPSELVDANYVHTTGDVSREEDLIKCFSEVRERFGRLDNLINNAGIAATNHSLLTASKTAQRILDVNVMGTYIAAREAARLMQPRKFGRIVNFSTVAVPLKIEGEAIYAASKAAIVTLTQILAKEFSRFGITVNAVGPTPILTDILSHLPKEKLDEVVKRQAVKRVGEMRDVSNVIDFFLQPESEFITGQVIYLGGVS